MGPMLSSSMVKMYYTYKLNKILNGTLQAALASIVVTTVIKTLGVGLHQQFL